MGHPPDEASKIAPEGRDTEFAPVDSVRQVRTTGTEDGPALVANRYELLGMLGGGAMGTVYRARDRELDEIVALKVLRRELAATEGMLERFRREVKLARRVTHRNVARTFDIGEHGGDRFLTMELVRGEGLASLLTRRGRLPLAEVVSISRDVCAGLSAAHAAGVLHRDLKPDNVVLAEDGRAVITDFGIARAASEGELGRTVGGIVGTPAYMAPEQVEGAPNLDARADLYALGAMIFELLTGSLPWTGETVIAVAAARLLQPPPDPRTHVADLPRARPNSFST
ncbi:Serine/threonine protein kinase [Labilithrix luteola]|uniref:Serine/threonine protein kinase n=1 Tax=Labilithrix luteola TaxID=1391654 RepID=A0A0K1QEH8_9BACT|nr:serine/threonine-protein kinase [Labilithrix luteola]AKV04164.1 Serine/threonine protein kinase [Labilithrix luteola]